MAQVLTNKTTHQYAIETTFKVQPTSGWRMLEPNSVGRFGAEITTVARDPISKNRQRRKGAIVNLESGVELETDFTRSAFRDFAESFFFASFVSSGGTGTGIFAPTAVVDGGGGDDYYSVAAGGAFAAGTLIFARGFTNSGNNGLFVTVSSIATEIRVATGTLTAEPAPPSNAEVAVAGVEGATGDLEIDANGDLISTVLDFTTLGLTVGQFINLPPAGSANGFATAGNEGFARIVSISANLIELDKRGQAFTLDSGAGQDIRVYYGQFLRNVAIDDPDFLEQSIHFEQVLPDLGGVGVDRYRYAEGNFANEMAISIPLTDKATCSFAFVGTDTGDPTPTRATGAASAIEPNSTDLIGTASNIARLRVQKLDETGISTCFKNVVLNIVNNVTPEVCIGTLGATFINFGNFIVDIEAQALFDDERVIEAIRAYESITMDFAVFNDDGAVLFDIPEGTLGDGSLELPVNESVLINQPLAAHQDPTLGYSMSVSMFPFTEE